MQRSLQKDGGQRDFSKIKHASGAREKGLARALDRPRILVADHDASTSELIASIGDPTYQVVAVSDGREAFRLLMRDASFSAAVFNMTMPHLQGVDILHYMKTEKRLMRVPVIVVGGDEGMTRIADSFAAGAIAFVSKPFGADQLARILQLVLHTRLIPIAVPRAA